MNDELRGAYEALRESGVEMSIAEFIAAADTPGDGGKSDYYAYLDKQNRKGR